MMKFSPIMILGIVLYTLGLYPLMSTNPESSHSHLPSQSKFHLSLFGDKHERERQQWLSIPPGSELTAGEADYRFRALEQVLLDLRQDGDYGYGTHLLALMVSVMNTRGPVFEMGSGKYSTPILHHLTRLCGQRDLLTGEAEEQWYNYTRDKYANDWHDVVWVKHFYDPTNTSDPRWGQAWSQVGRDTSWGVVLVDHDLSAQRGVDQHRMQSHSEIVIAHDAEDDTYEYDLSHSPAQNLFCFKMPRSRITSIISSKHINITDLFRDHANDYWPTIHGEYCSRVQEAFDLLPQYTNPDACDDNGVQGYVNTQRDHPELNPCNCYPRRGEDRSPRKLMRGETPEPETPEPTYGASRKKYHPLFPEERKLASGQS